MLDVLQGTRVPERLKLIVGVADVLPKLIVYRLLLPALRVSGGVEIVCREDRLERLVGELAIHSLDVVLADAPLPVNSGARAFNHVLGESGITFFAASKLARKLKSKFPHCLNDAPFLYPGAGTALRRSLDAWLDKRNLKPRSVGQFEDPALANTFGSAGAGIFIAPSVIESEVQKEHDVEAIGRTDAVTQRFYVISLERRIKHPGVAAISATARELLSKL
jgi:LysR family transcriptional activator of nhaA